jgi:RNA polymerase-binding transcription factor DksA
MLKVVGFIWLGANLLKEKTSKMNLLQKQLKAKLKEAEEELEQLEVQLEDRPNYGPGEGATLATSWEMTLARKQEVIARIKDLQQALERLQDGTYGTCEVCGNPINPERLKILPTASRCTNCA